MKKRKTRIKQAVEGEILAYLQNRQAAAHTAEIAEALSLTDYQARYYLMQMMKAGILSRTPSQRGAKTTWKLGQP